MLPQLPAPTQYERKQQAREDFHQTLALIVTKHIEKYGKPNRWTGRYYRNSVEIRTEGMLDAWFSLDPEGNLRSI